MAGRPNDKMFKTMVEKHGSEEAARNWFRSIGAIGGRNGNTGGFASIKLHTCNRLEGQHKIAKCAGMLGGTISRRGKAKSNV